MLEKILKNIDLHQEEIIQLLQSLIKKPSADGGPTEAQEVVIQELKNMGFDVDVFRGIPEHVKTFSDYCEPDIVYHKDAYNVGGVLNKNSSHSLMLFGHIDTEAEDYFGKFADPYATYIEDGRIVGLGASDDKGGIAMILAALKYTLEIIELPYQIQVLSILGKHGGAFGTLSALDRGYLAEKAIYLHPAETGHGFLEVKNISLGVVDLDIHIKGSMGILHDDLDTGKNSNVLAGSVITKLENWNQKKRKERIFDFGSFKGQPSYVLNIGSIISNNAYGGISQETILKVRIRFFKPYTIDDVVQELIQYLKDELKDDYQYIDVQKGNFKASPVLVENDDPFVKMIEKAITHVTQETDFIHQYHGGSDIRLPILYGVKCVGIGPKATLPLYQSGQREWLSLDDYLQGVKILATILYQYIEESFNL